MPKKIDELHEYVKRFWSRVDVGGDRCWNFIGKSKHPFGYGMVREPWFFNNRRGRQVSAHRMAWILLNGTPPQNLFVLHRCDNPACCNPKHLFLGTQADNMKDCIAKGRKRWRSGTQMGNAKLTDRIVRYCRKVYKPYHRVFSADALGKRFGISGANMLLVIKGKAWRHV